MEEINRENAENPKRPQFLTVLCILTFIFSGWGLIKSIGGFFIDQEEEMQKVQEAMDKMGDSADSGIMGKIMEGSVAMMEHQQSLNILSFVSCSLVLLGAIMMWRLRKTGFWIYTLSQVVSLAGTFAILGISFISMFSVGLGGVFSILFITLYALNLKHMK